MAKIIQKRTKPLKKSDVVRLIAISLCLAFCLVSMIIFMARRDPAKATMSILSILYVFIPDAVQRIFKFRIQTVLYIFVLLYTICPLLGYSYNLYYTTAWWDDLLHAFAGVVFAMFGAYLPRALNKKAPCSVALGAIFGLVFSIAVGSVWEFMEYGMDATFGTDMQKDTLLLSMRPSYILGEILGLPTGELGSGVPQSVITAPNGAVTEFKGYIDVGLIDTMHDMMVETAGALVYMAIYIVGKGKVFVFKPIESDPYDIFTADNNDEALVAQAASIKAEYEMSDGASSETETAQQLAITQLSAETSDEKERSATDM